MNIAQIEHSQSEQPSHNAQLNSQRIDLDTFSIINDSQREISTNNNNSIINSFTTMSSADNIIPTLTKTSSVEYANLFRGLSTFAMDSFQSIIEPHTASDSAKEQEKTYTNLADILLQHQDSIMAQAAQLSSSISLSTPSPPQFNGPAKLTRLNTVKEAIKVETTHEDDIIQIDRDSSETSTSSQSNNSIVEELTKNNNNNNNNTNKLKSNQTLVNNRNREKINVKRLSTTSTTSSTNSSNLPNENGTTKRRGRRPIGSNPENKMSKKQQIIEQSNGEMVYFGNKLVKKQTDEYEKRRRNNNEAVKKCREKLAQEQKEKEEKMKALNDENQRLNSTVDALSKELTLLKSIIIKMSPDQKLPEYLDQLIKNMDEDT